jgi:dipeptidyl aminopeptidase/acylaminoacyl peptidase
MGSPAQKYHVGSGLWLVFFLVELVPCLLMGQGSAKKTLTEQDYARWSELRTEYLSADGSWVSYTVAHPAADTLFVRNTRSLKTFAFPGGWQGRFVSKGHFAYMDKNSALHILDLRSGKRWLQNDVISWEPAASQIVIRFGTGGSSTLLISDYHGKRLAVIQDAGEYLVSKASSNILYSTLKAGLCSVGMLQPERGMKDSVLLSASCTGVYGLTWNAAGNTAAFLVEESSLPENKATLYLYSIYKGKLLRLGPEQIPKDSYVSYSDGLKLRINDSGSRVFFGMKKSGPYLPIPSQQVVEIWRSQDTLLYPMQKAVLSAGQKPNVLAVWNAENSSVYRIGKGNYDWAALNGDGQFVISSAAPAVGRFSDFFPPRDYYLTSTSTGETRLLLQGLPGAPYHMSSSPDGRYIAYYKAPDWMVYDITQDRHIPIASGGRQVWDNKLSDPDNTRMAFGAAGWTAAGMLLLYDTYDIWAAAPQGKPPIRITKGREKGIRYRVANSGYEEGFYNPYSFNTSKIIDTDSKLVLSELDLKTSRRGFCVLDGLGKTKRLTPAQDNSENLLLSSDSKTVLYGKESFEFPPRLMIKSLKDEKEKLVFQSNPHYIQYQWGKSKVFTFTTEGDTLRAALLYPAAYDSTKKYPMITYIYETMSQEAYHYVNPTLRNSIGINVSSLTAKGYFVLLPDIIYKNGDPGASVRRCVAAAVEKVTASGMVDSQRVGITGHSFGGYETNLLISSTNLFAAAVSGASIADPVMSYLSYSPSSGVIDYWRYEDHQFRIRSPLYDDVNQYLENSPLLAAGSITTPLLSWAGKDDIVVRSSQSEVFYSALRRLKKEHIMLLYPNEGHSLSNPENQADLTRRVESWFGHFLKGEPAEWIAKGQ